MGTHVPDDLRKDAEQIYTSAIRESMPGPAVKSMLDQIDLSGKTITLIAVGKAAWTMAEAALSHLNGGLLQGLVLTKYGHSMGALPGIEIMEAGHPLVDENSFAGTRRAIEMVQNLTADDTVLFLLSGGGSALFELSDLPIGELRTINEQLLACGADIYEINSIRKRLSRVKGGRFAQIASPARVISIVLSDVLGDRPDTIASGPTCPDRSDRDDAMRVVKKYNLQLSDQALACLQSDTAGSLPNAECHVCGSVRMLCQSAERACRKLGYETEILTDSLSCTAKDAGIFLSNIAETHVNSGKKQAFIVGGETVVHLSGDGSGGRNQELALAAAPGIAGMKNVAIFSVGSDGTDGPTDAAGGYVDGTTAPRLKELNIRISDVLSRNDSYHALKQVGGLIHTGPTGTNVNDLSVVLITA